MNELIEKLSDQAIEGMPGAWNIPDEFCEKFAKLIVQECMDVVDTGENQLIARFQARQWLAEHFGVK